MGTGAPSIPVSPEVADAFARASQEERDLAVRVMAGFLRPRSREEALAAFLDAQRRLSEEAEANGLTQEILDDILADEA